MPTDTQKIPALRPACRAAASAKSDVKSVVNSVASLSENQFYPVNPVYPVKSVFASGADHRLRVHSRFNKAEFPTEQTQF